MTRGTINLDDCTIVDARGDSIVPSDCLQVGVKEFTLYPYVINLTLIRRIFA
jgi:hypothetical protein